MNNSLLDFSRSFNLNNSPNDLTLTDTTPWVAQGIALTQVNGVFTLKSAIGIFHANVNYAAPDIDANVSLVFTHVLPIDVNGVVINGEYELTYSAKVTAEAKSWNIIALSQASQYFVISGNYLADILNATGGTFDVSGSTWNDGTYTIDTANCSYDVVLDRTTVATTGAIPSAVIDGTLDYTVDSIYTTTILEDFCFLEPSVEIEVTSSCLTGSLTSHDASTYSATSCGTILAPSSITRVHRLTYPISPSTGAAVHAQEVSSTDTITITTIWTETYIATVSTTLVYILPSGATYTVVVTGSTTHVVECEEGLCCAYDCIHNVYTNYLEAKATSLSQEAIKYQNLLIKVIAEWMLYSMATNCGDTDAAASELSNLIALVKADSCSCCNEPSNAPVQVVPLISISGGTGGTSIVTTCGNGITVTPSTLGTVTTYQVCLDMTIFNAAVAAGISTQALFDHTDTVQLSLVNKQVVMYNSTTGVWNNVLLGMTHISDIDLVTNPPADGYVLTYNGATGKAEFLPNVFANVLHNDIVNVGTDANLLEKTLKEYTITSPNNTLTTDGSFWKVEALFETAPALSRRPKIINFYFGNVPTLIQSISVYNPATIKFEANIARIAANTQIVEYVFYVGNAPATVLGYGKVNTSELLANTWYVRLTAQNSSTAVANSVVANYLRVTLNKK
jgi:hypothetical protein